MVSHMSAKYDGMLKKYCSKIRNHEVEMEVNIKQILKNAQADAKRIGCELDALTKLNRHDRFALKRFESVYEEFEKIKKQTDITSVKGLQEDMDEVRVLIAELRENILIRKDKQKKLKLKRENVAEDVKDLQKLRKQFKKFKKRRINYYPRD